MIFSELIISVSRRQEKCQRKPADQRVSTEQCRQRDIRQRDIAEEIRGEGGEKMTEQTGREPLTEGVFQVGVMVSDVEECLKLFCDTLGMKVVFDARNQVQPAKGLSGN